MLNKSQLNANLFYRQMRMIPFTTIFLAFAIIVAGLSPQSRSKFDNQWIASGVHDHTCYTQGLSFIDDTLILQSCGFRGESYYHILQYTLTPEKTTSLRQIYRSQIFDSKYFLEGSSLFPPNQVIYILTYQEFEVFRFNSSDYTEILPRLKWDGQGWGLTHNNTHMFITTGNYSIFVVDENLKVLQTLDIVDQNGQPLWLINEIEWVEENGQQFIYANIWKTTDIVKISIKEKRQVLRINQEKMRQNAISYEHGHVIEEKPDVNVLNGIAYDAANGLFVLTGKRWPRYYLSFLDYSPSQSTQL